MNKYGNIYYKVTFQPNIKNKSIYFDFESQDLIDK